MKKEKTRKTELIIMAVIFFSMLLLNFITPLIMDDFNYAYGLNGRISNLKEIFDFQVWHYLHWGGRSVAHSLVQFFLMHHKALFNILNTFMYVLLIYTIYVLINRGQKKNPLYLLLIHFALWFFTPAYGQSFLWLTGSCNYLWTATLILIFIEKITNEKFISKKSSNIKILLFFLFGVIVGWTNENSSASLVFMCASYLFFRKFISKRRISGIQLGGFLGSMIGFIVLILAPGNYARSKAVSENLSFIRKIITRLLSITENMIPITIFFVFILVIVLSITIYKKQKINENVFIFFIGTFVSIYSMVLSPVFPDRSWTITIILMILTCGVAISHLDIHLKIKKFILMDVVVLVSLVFLRGYILTLKDTYYFYQAWNYRIDTMEKGKKEGVLDFEFDLIYVNTKQTPSAGLGDLYEGKNDPNNQCVARYFHVNSVQLKPKKEIDA